MADVIAESSWPTRARWRQEFEKLEKSCPWPGPRPLSARDEEDHVLAGRQAEIAEFVAHVEGNRFIQLTGVSGVGKSSLLAVGLLPALAERYTVGTCRDWNLQAGERFDEYLAGQLHASLPDELKHFASDTDFFWDLEEFGDRAVIVLDQFEEMLRLESDSQEDALDFLYALLTNTHIKVVLSYRSEYGRQLRPLEKRNQKQWPQTHYELEPIADAAGLEIITTPRRSAGVASGEIISPEAATLLHTLWRAARRTATRTEIMVGPLHLQASLFALWQFADRRRIEVVDVRGLLARARTGVALDNEPATAVELLERWAANETELARETDTGGYALLAVAKGEIRDQLGDYRVLMEFALQESAMGRLRMAEDAARAIDMDEYLVSGIATRLIAIVPHLSSGTYKLDRQLDDLVDTVLKQQIVRVTETLDEGDRQQVMDYLYRLISDSHWREIVSSATRADILRARGAGFGISGPLLDGLAQRSSDLGSGPMRGTADIEVLIEELRRFAWAVAWLHDLNIARTKDAHSGAATMSLIHDGFGPAMIRWRDRFRAEHGVWALRALTSPQGEEHIWGAIGEEFYQDQLTGTAAEPALHANLAMKGNSILFATIRDSVFVNCDFRGCLFLRCTFGAVTFLNCSLDGALFSDCVVETGSGAEATDGIELAVEEQPYYFLGEGDATRVPRLAATIARYRERGETGSLLQVPEPDQPTTSVGERGALLPWSRARQGMVFEGARLSALTIRGTDFRNGASVQFKRVRGAGVDIAELEWAAATESVATFEFRESALRHVAFSTSRVDDGPSDRAQLADVRVTVRDCLLAQWWIGSGLVGELDVADSMAAHIWVESDAVKASVTSSAVTGMVRVQVVDGYELPWADAAAAAGLPPVPNAVAQQFRERVVRTDYRR